MPLLLMKLVFASLGKPPVPFGVRSLGSLLGKGIQKAWLDPQLATHARFIDDHLATRPWFAGEQLSMADIQMSFPVMALLARGGMDDLRHIEAWRQRVEQRPAWQRAIERGGPFTLPGA
jgi:glutathione S-transferase